MVACERVFNLHARPAKNKREVEVTSCRRLCPLKGSICDGYQMQLSERHKPLFTKDFPLSLSCIQMEGFKITPWILNQRRLVMFLFVNIYCIYRFNMNINHPFIFNNLQTTLKECQNFKLKSPYV